LSVPATNPWIAARAPKPEAEVRLFCFPFAGGGASTYRDWQSALGPRIDVYPVQLPGREDRLKERPESSMRVLASRLADALRPLLRGRFAFFGHSMGALIQYELTRELERRGADLPFMILPAARRAPHIALQSEPIHELSDEAFLKRLIDRYQAIPASVLAEPELMALFLPMLKADFRMLETYRYEDAAALRAPISAFAGARDAGETAALVWKWRELTAGPFRLDVIDGGHFFLSESRATLLPAVSSALLRALDHTGAARERAAGSAGLCASIRRQRRLSRRSRGSARRCLIMEAAISLEARCATSPTRRPRSSTRSSARAPIS
jgi:medium-chain acyl-[acyl-carrier-protein] hydrolase